MDLRLLCEMIRRQGNIVDKSTQIELHSIDKNSMNVEKVIVFVRRKSLKDVASVRGKSLYIYHYTKKFFYDKSQERLRISLGFA